MKLFDFFIRALLLLLFYLFVRFNGSGSTSQDQYRNFRHERQTQQQQNSARWTFFVHDHRRERYVNFEDFDSAYYEYSTHTGDICRGMSFVL